MSPIFLTIKVLWQPRRMLGTPRIPENQRRQAPEFHGAFNGGFSAGYFNTVGSAEGFTPKSFHSTREKRAKINKQNNALDSFMDDEDRFQYQQSMILVPADPIKLKDSSYLDTLLGADQMEPAWLKGYQVMMNLGWRPGQAIGPKELREINSFSGGKKRYAFVPRELKTGSTERSQTDNYKNYGLGYDVVLPELVSDTGKPKKKKRIAVKLSIGSDSEDEGGPVLRKRRIENGPRFQPKVEKNTQKAQFMILEKCSDGSRPLDGFEINTLRLLPESFYDIPPDLDDFPSSTEDRAVRDENQSKDIFIKSEVESPKFTVKNQEDEKGAQEKPSVFSFMAPDQREKLFPFVGKREPSGSQHDPLISKNVALAAMENPSLPYGSDLAKRERYLSFLRDQASGIKSETMPSTESLEFANVATVFKPLTGTMASRFVGERPKIKMKKEESFGPSGLGIKPRLQMTAWRPSRLLAKRLGIPYKKLEVEKKGRENDV